MKKIIVYSIIMLFIMNTYCQTNKSETSTKPTTKVEHLTKATFLTKVFDYEKNKEKWVYAGKIPCVIDFYANWCGPCKMMSPILDELSIKYAGKVIIYKVNVDQEKELSSVFGISGIPAFLFSPKTTDPYFVTGYHAKDAFEKQILDLISKK